jgi:predicted lipid-binding transport protein (Tim44 family)
VYPVDSGVPVHPFASARDEVISGVPGGLMFGLEFGQLVRQNFCSGFSGFFSGLSAEIRAIRG